MLYYVLTLIGLNEQACELFNILFMVAGILGFAILLAWHVYGNQIAALYDEHLLAREQRLKTSKHISLSMGEAVRKKGDYLHTWHARRELASPPRCTPAHFEVPSIADGKHASSHDHNTKEQDAKGSGEGKESKKSR